MLNPDTQIKLKEIVILLVDDDVELTKNMSRFLARFCKQVVVAKDGLEGVRVFEKYKPDLVITDVTMPKLDGIGMVHKIKKIKPDIRVIFTTARHGALDGLSIDNCVGLKKPFLSEELFAAFEMFFV